MIPTPQEKTVATITAGSESCALIPPISKNEISAVSPPPRMMPMIPPIPEMITDSHKNCAIMDPVFAPNDLRIPISRFRDGYEHDVHNADSSDDKRDSGDERHECCDGIHDRTEHIGEIDGFLLHKRFIAQVLMSGI